MPSPRLLLPNAVWGLCLTALLFFHPGSPVEQVRADQKINRRAALSSITSAELKRHVDVLADDTFEGRQAGSRGGRAAAKYLTDHLRKYGLKGGGERGAFTQPFGAGYNNVLGVLEGSDPKLRNEYVVVGAHYDHVGYGDSTNSFGPIGYIHNGADDNASGVAGVLETIEAFTKLSSRPKRSILFAFWDGEEIGLLGSKHWVNYPTVPLGNVVFMLNCDMIGRLRNNRVEVYGSRTGRGLRRLLSEQNERTQLQLHFIWELEENSDHAPFFQRGIPVIMLHTGLHDDYHRPRDDAHLIDHAGLLRIAKLMFRVAHQAADQPARIAFRSRSRVESPFNKMTLERVRPSRPPRFGIAWTRKPEQPGIIINQVTPNSPAHRAGLAAGDRILQFNSRPIGSDDELLNQIWNASGKAVVQVERFGASGPGEATIDLPLNPIRVGVSWKEDDAEPATILLTEVISGSPAHRAGLRPLDRVYSLEGMRFENGTRFKQILASLSGLVDVVVERRGQLRTVQLQLPPSTVN